MVGVTVTPGSGGFFSSVCRGAIVGSDQVTGAAFLYEDGAVTALMDLPEMRAAGWTAFTPWGINDRGWIVGSAWKPGIAFSCTALLLIPK